MARISNPLPLAEGQAELPSLPPAQLCSSEQLARPPGHSSASQETWADAAETFDPVSVLHQCFNKNQGAVRGY